MRIKNNFQLSIFNFQLIFKQPAGTSRGIYTTRKIWYVLLTSHEHPEKWGIGECAPLPDLSCDALSNYEEILKDTCRNIQNTGKLDTNILRSYPSILFGLETAFRHFEKTSFALWDSPFSSGETGIPINGLIWMGEYGKMLEQIETKLERGFRCIKLKIGAIQFEKELELLRHIRKHFSVADIELRVDANGAFSPQEALDKLNRLAEFDIHSIEQPIRAGQWEEMAKLAETTPLSIALDEELIGYNKLDDKKQLLDIIKPQYIVLKPSLHGGISGSEEWIAEAEKRQIGWWVTSALESNIGLNAIAQWTASIITSQRVENRKQKAIYQGLGTGGLFINNIEMPLSIKQDNLYFTPNTEYASVYKKYFSFVAEWFNDSLYIPVQTSGSTGNPKLLNIEKEKMKFSASQTCSFLNLQKGDTALLCMDLQYIGAKMMVVRALICNLELIIRDASGHPLKDIEMPLQFAAMTPIQIFNSLQVPEERERLIQIENLIIGGGAISPYLEKELQSFPNKVYSTYAMTETLSHIALRRLNGSEASIYYTPFPYVKLSLSKENTLIIEAPELLSEPLLTNDIAEIHTDGTFRILGRKDNIINTGGIKVQAESIEEKLRIILSMPLVITSVPDPKFGEAIVLLIEGEINIEQVRQQIYHLLPSIERPKHIFMARTIPITKNGKIDRAGCKKIARQLIK